MPTYEYECKTCGCVFDVFQSIKSAPLRRSRCEKCGEIQPVRRLISTGGAVLFKGSGFYQTDYRSESYKEKAKSESPAKETSGGDKKADSTKSAPAEKPDKSERADARSSSSKKDAGK